MNEGWEPVFFGPDLLFWYYVYYVTSDNTLQVSDAAITTHDPYTLIFKSKMVAEFAAKQFRDLYLDLYMKLNEDV